MQQIFNDFGINSFLLTAQVVNFLVLLFILQKFLYKPILKVLNERKQKISDSLKTAEKIEETLLKTEEEKEKKLEIASIEAKKIIEDATKSAEGLISEAREKTQSDIQLLLQKAQESISQEREKMFQEVRSQTAEIVVTALEKVIGKILTKSEQKKMIEDTIKSL